VRFFLGIDGGGSKTRCLLGDERAELGSGSAGACNVVRVGEACAQSSLEAAIHEACAGAGISPRDISRTCAGVAGGGRAEIERALHHIIAGMVAGEIEIVGDMEIAHEAAFGGKPGLIVIAGTGSLAFGKNARGETLRAGGWGRVISDDGSGHWIGVEAIRAALRARDRGEKTQLLENLVDGFGAESVEELIIKANGDPMPDFAAMFPVVLAAAESGDEVAVNTLDRAGHQLATTAETVLRRLFNSDDVSVAVHGGVLTTADRVRKSFMGELHARCPQTKVISLTVDPALGALRRARVGSVLRIAERT